MAANGQIRAFACTTKELTEHARQVHNTSPVATAALGRLMAGGLMMGSMLKGEKDLVTLKIEGAGPAKGALVTADAFGRVKGYVSMPDVMLPPRADGKLDVGNAFGAGFLSVIKDMGLKEPYVGQTVLQTGEIAEDLTYYFATSEQVPSSVGLGVLMNKENTVRQAGGFIIQLLPFAEDEVIDKLEENIKNLKSVTSMLDAGMTPEDMLGELLGNMDLKITDTLPASFHCNCSKDRFTRGLMSIGKKEISEMIADGKPITVNCHFCNSDYIFNMEDLKEIIKYAK
ncbi:MAG: Hsp33 family molecular chaperone HslO [Lachnospiraceae bacterium]|nr:Hsp33 family molecular chaperone HslO [Lachnospiraceae bacterium]